MSTTKTVTAFQQRVYDAVRLIPPGCVATYGGVARFLGMRSARAVGQALRRNPFAPQVPCHRVIASGLAIGGFNGRRQGAEIRRKLALLAAEGVLFERGQLKDAGQLWNFRKV
jgi:methylated-DNA-[protein]-cysteine S-methyltransferase